MNAPTSQCLRETQLGIGKSAKGYELRKKKL